MDSKFTLQLKEWLETPPEKRDYMVGALYLLKLSGNKVMYSNIVANINRHRLHVDHQLQKYYDFRVQALTHEQVTQMAEQVDVIVKEYSLDEHPQTANKQPTNANQQPKSLGKRDDHDSLPDDIQAMFVENLSLLRRMRELHLKLRSLSTENATCPDSERYPFYKELIELDKKMHSNWETYDSYPPNR